MAEKAPTTCLDYYAYWCRAEKDLLSSGASLSSEGYDSFQKLRKKWNPTVEEILLTLRSALDEVKKQLVDWYGEDNERAKDSLIKQIEIFIELSAIDGLESQKKLGEIFWHYKELLFSAPYWALQKLSSPDDGGEFGVLLFFHIFGRQSAEDRVAITQGLQGMLAEAKAD